MDDRTAFRQSMQAKLHDMEAELENWEAADEKNGGAAQQRREEQQMLNNLHEKRLQAREYLDQVARSNDWQTLKPKMEHLWAEMATQIETIKARV